MKFATEALIQPPSWYSNERAIQLANNVLKFQHMNGGWYKTDEMDTVITEELEAELAVRKFAEPKNVGFDDLTTWPQIRFLTLVYNMTNMEEFANGAARGVSYALGAQLKCGGWPHFHPHMPQHYTKDVSMHAQITPNLTHLMFDIVNKPLLFSFLSSSLKKSAKKAATRGLNLILNLQQINNGERTGWAEHYDPDTLEPKNGRPFEPAAIDSLETSRIITWLSSHVGSAVAEAVICGKKWLKKVAIHGIEWVDRPFRGIAYKPDAPRMWSRFYTLEENIPIFGDNDGSITYCYNQLSKERRRGYGWFGFWGENALKET
jgi:PelA/Pel-15E family pectate lyase